VCTAGVCTAPLGCTFNTALLPQTVHPSNYFGDLTFDGSCNLIVTGGFNNALYKIDKTTGNVSTFAQGFPNFSASNGITYRSSDGFVYVSLEPNGQVYKVDSNGVFSLVASTGMTINAIALSPASFAPYGNQVIVAHQDGTVAAVDPANGAVSSFASTGGSLSDLTFAPNGVLYVANYANNAIQTVSAAGSVQTFASGFSGVDGIAVHPDGTRILAACSGNGTIQSVSIPGGALSLLKNVTLDGGYYVSGILTDLSGNVLYKTSANGSAVIDFVKP
jgi:sugar lactone lactonase YvrE